MRGNHDTCIVSISLPERLARQMDTMVGSLGYMSRSELVRDAVREFIEHRRELDNASGHLDGVITLLYRHDHGGRVSEVRHQYMDVFRSFMHSDFPSDACSCCETLVFSGEADRVRAAYNELRALKGVENAQIFVAPEQITCEEWSDAGRVRRLAEPG